MYVGSAVAVSLSSWSYSRVAAAFRLDRLIIYCTVGLLAAALLLRAALALKKPSVYPVLYVMVEVMGSMGLRGSVAAAIRGVDQASRDLLLLSELLVRIEQEGFSAPRLESLQGELSETGLSPPQSAIL